MVFQHVNTTTHSHRKYCLHLQCRDTLQKQNAGLAIVAEGLNCCNNMGGKLWGGRVGRKEGEGEGEILMSIELDHGK